MGHPRLEVVRRRDAVRADYPDQSADSDRGGVRSGIEYRSADPGGQPGGTESERFTTLEAIREIAPRRSFENAPRRLVSSAALRSAWCASLRMTERTWNRVACHPERSEQRERSRRISDSFAPAKPVPVLFFTLPGDGRQMLEQSSITDTDCRLSAPNRWLLPGPGYRFHRNSVLMRAPTFGSAVALRPPVSARLKFAFTAIAQPHPHLQPQSDPESNASVSLGALASAFRV
jgi:hypothetical protein